MNNWNDNIPITRNKANEIISNHISQFCPDDDGLSEINSTNKLSMTYQYKENYIIKLVTRRHVEAHRVFSSFWNISLLPNQTVNLFESYKNPYDMVKFEYDTLYNMRNIGVNVPKPTQVEKGNGYAILTMEYIPDAIEYANISDENSVEHTKELFNSVRLMHKNDIPHGDLQKDNVIISKDDLYIIDPTKVRTNDDDFIYYDVANALCTATSKVEPNTVLDIAEEYFDADILSECLKFIPAVSIQFGQDIMSIELLNLMRSRDY